MSSVTRPHVLVIGGGLAGLTAALGCSDRGMRVTLLEGRPRLGGATWSFNRKGLMFDNGQHVYLACCDAYRRYLDRVGSTTKAPLHKLAIPVLRPRVAGENPSVSWIRRNGLPAPLHLASSLSRYRYLSLIDRLKIGRAAIALRRLDLNDPRLDEETFAHFLGRHGQSEQAIAGLWNLIVLPTINLRAEEASLLLAAKVFQTGLLAKSDAADIGWAEVPLSELHVDPAVAILETAGASIRSRARVSSLVVEQNPDSAMRVTGAVVDGETVHADAVILATGPLEAAELLPMQSGVDREGLRKLGTSPIIDVHIVYDRPVTNYRIAAGIDTPVQYVFDCSRSSGIAPEDGQSLAVSISGADDEQGERPEVLIERYTDAITMLFPNAGKAKIIDAVVSREHAATFRARPGTKAFRPGVTTAIGNLAVAGTYTDTGWPATMEGAVRSGELAVAHIARAVGSMRFSDELTSLKETI